MYIGSEILSDIIKNLNLDEEQMSKLKDLSEMKTGVNEDAIMVGCGALMAMTNHFVRFVRDVKPKYMAIVFDSVSYI